MTNYDTIDNETFEELMSMRDFLLEKRDFFTNRKNTTKIIERLSMLISCIDIKLQSECKHEYEEDYIDVDVEKSVRITYCKLCWCTFKTS
jgi:hypothetical protein